MPDDLDWEGMDPPGPQTERERDTTARDVRDKELGQSDELDGDAGDIADEGPGRRG